MQSSSWLLIITYAHILGTLNPAVLQLLSTLPPLIILKYYCTVIATGEGEAKVKHSLGLYVLQQLKPSTEPSFKALLQAVHADQKYADEMELSKLRKFLAGAYSMCSQAYRAC